ncbi:MAG: TIGR02391 family protein [Syntrophaceae bacterium]|nr:TIGR02391 family protein [Syntrophaceae bacterium]
MSKKNEPEIREAHLSSNTMRAALPKISRRIEELEKFDVNQVPKRFDPQVQSLEHKYDDTLLEIFGKDTVEYKRYRMDNFDTAPLVTGRPQPIDIVREGLKSGIAQAISHLKTIQELFQEKIRDMESSTNGFAMISLDSIDLHLQIREAVYKLFQGGHYANAVEDGCKTLDFLVKIKSGRHDLSGADLMQTVFSVNDPILKFNNLKNEEDISEQQGMMFLYAGAMMALRNPGARQIMQDHPESAFELIIFVNYLAKSLDRAVKNI